MIIVGICLVTAAIVYGFVDYLKTDKKQLQQMYGDEPVPATAAKTPATPVVLPVKTDTAKTSESSLTKRRHKKLNLKSYSRSEEVYIPADSTAQAAPVVTPAKKPVVLRQKKEEEIVFKKPDASSFSRSSLRKTVLTMGSRSKGFLYGIESCDAGVGCAVYD